MSCSNIEKSRNEQGSATVEAIISFCGFLFVIFTVLNVINFCRAQMLISNAVDTATKEISQYSYFYKMSGLQKFSEDISSNAEEGKTNLNDVLSTVDGLYTSLGTAVDNTADNVTNVKNSVEAGNADIDQIKNTIAGIKSDGTNIKTAMSSVMSAYSTVQDNPMLYLKSIVAVAGNEALDLAKSHIIAAPLAKMFTVKHFGATTGEADECCKNLGIVDGLDGMNFNMSTVFSSKSPEDVHIIVYYKLRIVQLFGWTTLEVPMCKESVSRAWLGGDDVQKKVKPMVTVNTEDDEDENEDESPEDSEDRPEETTTDGKDKVEPTTKVDIEGSYWHLGDGGYGIKNAGRDEAFMKKFFYDNNIDEENGLMFGAIVKSNNKNEYYSCDVVTNADKFYTEYYYLDGLRQIKEDEVAGKISDKEMMKYTFIIYVPENIPDDEYKKIVDQINKVNEVYRYQASSDKAGEYPKNVKSKYEIVRAGGNYDYGSGSE